MTGRTRRRGQWGLAALAIVAGVLAVLRPWTVVPIETSVSPAFDANEYVASVWPTRVLDFAETSAVDVEALRRETAGAAPETPTQRRAVFVRGAGVVADVDRASRVGVARVRVGPGEGATVAIQIGPVIRGTALRDALAFVQFTDFVNQLEFAAVANALNDRVLADVIGKQPLDELEGQRVTFVGAAVVSGSAQQPLEIVPVRLEPVGGAS